MLLSPRSVLVGLLTRHRSVRTALRPAYAEMSSLARYHLRKEAQLVIQKGDITQWEGDAVVNAANERMLGGGGVDGAIHRAAGPSLLQACRRYPDILNERCPTGDARVTLAYEMPCNWIIHTVGPIFSKSKSRQCQAQLVSAYTSSLALANGLGAATIAFPAISCGIYGYPLQSACADALKACWDNSGDLKEVHFVLFGSDTYDVWLAEADKHLKPVVDSADSTQVGNNNAATLGTATDDEASPMQGTTSADQSHAAAAAQSPQLSPDSRDESAREEASMDESRKEDTAVQTLTGVKEGKDSEPAQEALAAPEVLEAIKPATDADLPGHR